MTPTLPLSSPPTRSGAALTNTSRRCGPTRSRAPRTARRVRSTRRCTLSPSAMSAVTGRPAPPPRRAPCSRCRPGSTSTVSPFGSAIEIASSEHWMMASESSRRSRAARSSPASAWTSETSRKIATAPSISPPRPRTTTRLVRMVVVPTSWYWFSSSLPLRTTSGRRLFTHHLGHRPAQGRRPRARAGSRRAGVEEDDAGQASTAMSPSTVASRMASSWRARHRVGDRHEASGTLKQ